VIECLNGLVGDWAGVNRFRLMPDDAAVPLESSARVAIAAGHGITVAYSWIHPADGAQQGFLFLFDGEQAGLTVGVWLDTWHQAPQPMRLAGTPVDSGVRLTATYGDGWDWTIRIGAGPDADLLFAMDNQGPEVEAYQTMTAVYNRMR
jgi:hypothetical protein